MSDTNAETVIVDVGKRPSAFYDWATAKFNFHDFEDLPKLRNRRVESPTISCLGHLWKCVIFPGGDAGSTEGQVAVYLSIESSGAVDLIYSFGVHDLDGKELAQGDSVNTFVFVDESRSWGFADFSEYETLLDSLYEGTLTIEIRMALKYPPDSPGPQFFVPPNNFSSSMQETFLDEKTADIVIEVRNNESSLNDTSPPERFHVHRLILQQCAKTMAMLCETCNTEVPLEIHGVKPSVFYILLQHIYGKDISKQDLEANAQDIIVAADKYDIVGLKLEAEASYVKSTTININNVMDNLLFADAKNCALLKEAVMDFIVKNGREVFNAVSLNNVPATMFSELLAAMNRKEMGGGNDEHSASEFGSMSVNTLRKLCYEKGLPVDGSRETMTASLKTVEK